MSITSSNPVDIKVADNAQLMGLNLGNGFFSLPGTVVINGVTMAFNQAMGQIIPGAGMQIQVRDYFAMCNGIILGHGCLAEVDFENQLTTVQIPGAGTWYVVMNPSTYVGFDGTERPDYAPGIITVQSSLPLPDTSPNTILVGTVTVPALSSPVLTSLTISHVGALDNNGNNTLTVGSTTGIVVGSTVIQGVNTGLVVSITNATKFVVTGIPGPANWVTGAATVVETVQITTGMIDNSDKQFLTTVPEIIEQIGQVPSNLQNQIFALQASVAALQAQVNSQSNLVTTTLITSANVDLVNSNIGLLGTNQFVLPGFNPTIYFEESFALPNGAAPTAQSAATVGTYFTNNFGGTGVSITNDQLVLSDGNGDYGNVAYVANNPTTAGQVSLQFDCTWGVGPNNTVSALAYVGQGWGYCYFGEYIFNIGVIFGNDGAPIWNISVGSYYSGQDLVSYQYFNQLGAWTGVEDGQNVANNATVTIRLVFNNPNILMYANGNLVFSIVDPDFWVGQWDEFSFYPLQSTTYVGMANVTLESPVLGNYQLNGTLQTLTLPSTATLLRAVAGFESSVPSGTTLALQMSLNGGTDWTSISTNEVIDGSVEPYNGTGTDLRLKAVFTSNNNNTTPVLGPITVSSSRF